MPLSEYIINIDDLKDRLNAKIKDFKAIEDHRGVRTVNKDGALDKLEIVADILNNPEKYEEYKYQGYNNHLIVDLMEGFEVMSMGEAILYRHALRQESEQKRIDRKNRLTA